MSRILLIVGGGIAAYKAAELIRLARKAGHSVTPVLTAGGAHFVTPMSLAALAESPVYTSLWDLKDEAEMGHIQLSAAPPTSSSSAPPPPTSSPRWPRASPTTSPRPCCSPPTSPSSSRRR